VIAPDTDRGELEAALRELRQIERELTERDLVRRSDALDEIQEGVEDLGEIGSSTAILERAAKTLGDNSRFEAVLVSQVDGDLLVPRSFWTRSGPASGWVAEIEKLDMPLGYPLIEAEVLRHGGEATTVEVGPRSPAKLRDLLGWRRYVVAPLRLRESPIGLLHAELDVAGELDVEVADIYANGLTSAFERAVLRETVQRHREELRGAVVGIGDHLDESPPGLQLPPPAGRENAGGGDRENLTRRESEILKLLGQGKTNGTIATSLLISESTVKFHVKNILLKLGATSRADAVARYLRGDW
jgi:LuxR family transcriptional regulator, regulator of acetate metabolism